MNAIFDFNLLRLAVPLCLLLTAVPPLQAQSAASPLTCQARSPVRQAQLVELYTSEGCSSCPPADRWLSGLKGRPEMLAAAFHVDYWDRLGWMDRFGNARHTARQAEQHRSSGAGFSYTPQVLVNGRDWRGGATLPALDKLAVVQVGLQRQDAQQVSVAVTAMRGAPARLGLWWALLEDDHQTVVAAGENQGVRLHHDHVVRQYNRVADWAAVDGATQAIKLAAAHNGEAGHKARLLVVVTDATTGAPLQAVQLGC